MSLADRIIPPEALRWGTLTRAWPALDIWVRANPSMGVRVDSSALWAEYERNLESP